MALVGFTWFLGALTSADNAWVFTLGVVLESLWVGALVQILVAFPSGRVAPGLERAMVILGWSASIVLPFGNALVTADPEECGDCPDNILLVTDSDAAGTVFQIVNGVVTVVPLVGSA
jgi:hypothetical protein